MQELKKLETDGQKKPLIYLEYEGSTVRAVLDNSNKAWLVLGDLCEVLNFSNQESVLRQDSLKPHLASAILETSSGQYNLCLISLTGFEVMFTIFNLFAYRQFLCWANKTLSDIRHNRCNNPPRIDINNLDFLEG